MAESDELFSESGSEENPSSPEIPLVGIRPLRCRVSDGSGPSDEERGQPKECRFVQLQG